MYGIVIHGGAGTIQKNAMTPELEQEYRTELKEALRIGYQVLEQGGSSLDAVEAAVVRMEDSHLFNAGKGSVLTHESTIEMDASIMDGTSGDAGAVAAVKTIKNPISAARKVLEQSPHVMLGGAGADHFAKNAGLKTMEPSYFKTEKRLKQLQRIIDSEKVELDHGSSGSEAPAPPGSDKYGTVGAVALDKNGHMAAATSTGGMTNKRWGRIGDSPIIGAGTYAKNSTCAVSCTGHGEYFIREAIAHSVSARMEYGKASLGQAAKDTIFEQLEATGGKGGLIAIDSNGQIAMPYNTGGMYRGFQLSDGASDIHIWEK